MGPEELPIEANIEEHIGEVTDDFRDFSAQAPKLDLLKNKWRSSAVFRSTRLHKYYEQKLNKLRELIPADILNQVLPSPRIRPLLAAAIVSELSSFNFEKNDISLKSLKEHSPILNILNYPYKPTFLSNVIESLSDLSDDYSSFKDTLSKIIKDAGGINSTFRNLLIADRLNETVLRETQYVAKIALAKYSWSELNAEVSDFSLPELPKGCAEKLSVKFVIALTKDDEPQDYLDYGQSEGEERYGISATGEGLGNIVGTPPPQKLYYPTNKIDVIDALKVVEASQSKKGEREAVRRMSLHKSMTKHLVDFVQTNQGLNFPSIISSVYDLTDSQLQSVLLWSDHIQNMTKGSIEQVSHQQMILGTGMVFTPLEGMHARIESSQPSTRTVTAAADAMRALGLEVDIPAMSSRDKGESAISEGVTLTTHRVDVVLRRDKDFEKESELLSKFGDSLPVRISLGGNMHHPTQTLGEIKALMDLFDCKSYSIEELRKLTTKNPPKITFVGRTDQKRADKALILFILNRLPEWKVEVLVPEKQDVPSFEVPANANYNVKVILNLSDENCMLDQTRDSNLVYISNAEATSKIDEKGRGQGKKIAPHFLSDRIVNENDFWVMHPLPASGELEDSVFSNPKSLIQIQMENKIYVIASLVAHQLMAKKERIKFA